jgi:YidC/Oxa1 family membrane protein insertase
MLMMPVVFTIMFVIHPFPAGLVLYWLVNNLISITQQWYLRSDKKASPFHATAIAAVGIFSFAFVLTLL